MQAAGGRGRVRRGRGLGRRRAGAAAAGQLARGRGARGAGEARGRGRGRRGRGRRGRPAPALEALQAARGGNRPSRVRARGPRIPLRPVLVACREDRSTFFYICVFLFDFRVFDFVSHRSEKILK